MSAIVIDHGPARVHILPVRSDNYTYIVEWDKGCAVIDPSEYEPVSRLLQSLSKALDRIVLTHSHADHVAGAADLVDRFAGSLLGPSSARLGSGFQAVKEGDRIAAGPLSFRVLATPGHTAGCLSYYEADTGMLFCGDTLFAGGCGRLFECPPEVMWNSLQRLMQLPADTRIYCGHEYTRDNLAFARTIWPGNRDLAHRAAQVEKLRSRGQPTIPSTVKAELATNIFLLAGQPELKKLLGLGDASDAKVFAELRRRKDH